MRAQSTQQPPQAHCQKSGTLARIIWLVEPETPISRISHLTERRRATSSYSWPPHYFSISRIRIYIFIYWSILNLVRSFPFHALSVGRGSTMFSRWRPAALGRGMRATAFSMQATEVSAGTTVPLRQVPSLPIVGSLPYLPIKASETASSTFKLWRLLGQQHGPFFRCGGRWPNYCHMQSHLVAIRTPIFWPWPHARSHHVERTHLPPEPPRDVRLRPPAVRRMTFPATGVIHVLEDPHEMSKVLQAEGRHPNGIIQLQWPVYRCPPTPSAPPHARPGTPIVSFSCSS